LGFTPRFPETIMRGRRDKIIHDYIDVEWDVVWNTVQYDLSALRQQVAEPLNGLARRKER